MEFKSGGRLALCFLVLGGSFFVDSFAQQTIKQQDPPAEPAPAIKPKMTTRSYIDSFKLAAMVEMKAYGIPASITLGQGILESASGNSKLAKECNNHFGIKCRSTWTGRFCLADDDAKDECFRGYLTANESYRDHSLFLYESKRYAKLFELASTDYKNWANGLREAGYATNPSYGNLLIGVIEKYRLAMYDSMVVMGEDFYTPSTATKAASDVNGIPAIMAKPGETPEQLAARYNLEVWQIYKYNDIKQGDQINPGEIIYLKPKKKRSVEATHTVKQGETLHDISQMYGIKMKHLYKLNRLTPGQEAQIGEIINLRDKREQAPKVASATVSTSAVDIILTKQKVENSANPLQTAANGSVYEVQKGETLQQIAARFNTTPLNLARWNNLDMLEVSAGQILVLKPNVKPTGSEVPESRLNGINSVTAPASDTYHFVQPGETLYSISKKYGVTVDSVKYLNKLGDNQIRVGQRLKVR
jgi:LysM repeat protein